MRPRTYPVRVQVGFRLSVKRATALRVLAQVRGVSVNSLVGAAVDSFYGPLMGGMWKEETDERSLTAAQDAQIAEENEEESI